MRRTAFVVLPLLLMALACAASTSFAQSGPGPTTGGVVITLSPEDGAPLPASAARTLTRSDLLAARRWLMSFAAPVLPATGRPSLKPRRASLVRTPVRIP